MKRIIEIKALDNGGHRNQTTIDITSIPEDWAVIPDEMETPNFPFGEVEIKDEDVIENEQVVGTVKVVTKWIPGVIPEPEVIPEPINDDLTTNDLANAILEGVNEI